MTNEIWKDIKGYEGKYQVSNLGRVKSLSRMKYMGSSGYRLMPEKILKQANKRGYQTVVLCNDNEHKTTGVHRLVALSFIPNPKNLPQVNHIDENKCNNNVDNLEWVTCKENINHGTSLIKRAMSQRVSKANKKVYQYDMNGNLVGTYISTHDASRQTGFDRGAIGHCCNNDVGFRTHKGYRWSYEKENKPTRSAVG